MSSGNPQTTDNLTHPLSTGKSSGQWPHPSYRHCTFLKECLTIVPYHSLTGVAMMGIQELLKAKRNEILDLTAKHGATKIRLIGSVARREETQESDIDFLVEIESGRSLLDHAALILDLEALLGRKVDIASDRGLRPRVRERVLKEAIPL